MSTQDKFFIRLRGSIRGPYTTEQLKRMATRGQFSTLHQVSTDQQNWQSAVALTDVFASTKPTVDEAKSSSVNQAPAEWYYTVGNQRLGPVSESVIHDMVRSGTLTAKTLTWKAGQADWQEASKVLPAQLFPKPKWSAVKVGAIVLGSVLFLAVAIGMGYLFVSNTRDIPSPSLTSVGRPTERSDDRSANATEIRSVDLTNPEFESAVSDAIGMLVFYVSIDMETGEHHELWVSHGTCFVVNGQGHAITNDHVVEDYQLWLAATKAGRRERLNDLLREMYGIDPAESEKSKRVTEVMLSRIQKTSAIEPKLAVYFDSPQIHDAELIPIETDFDLAVVKVKSLEKPHFFSLSTENSPPRSLKVQALGYPGVAQGAITDEERAILEAKQEDDLDSILFGTKNHRDVKKTAAFSFISTPGELSVVQREGAVFSILHTAPIRGGNSGGPLVFAAGEQAGVVLGINTLVRSDKQASVFIAFPIAQMREILDETIPELTWR